MFPCAGVIWYGSDAMIGRLVGQVAQESADGTVVIDVNGVGYEVMAPIGSLGRARRDESGRVTLLVHTHVREDAITLFAFADELERTTFRLLTGVNGVGPKIAIGILGGLPSHELAAAVARGDAKRLQAVPGVGRKIAERLLLELKDKIAAGVLAGAGAGAGSHASAGAVPAGSTGGAAAVGRGGDYGAGGLGRDGPLASVASALTRLGFRPLEAERAAASLAGREAEPIDALVRDALKVLTQ